VDLAGCRGLLGQRDARTSKTVVGLGEQSPQFREAIQFVGIDPAEFYAKSVAPRGCCPTRDWSSITFHFVTLVERVRDQGVDAEPILDDPMTP
jgi:hypothetical protein